MRIDKFLADSGLVKSREAAQRLIREGNVTADGKAVSKPSYEINPDMPPQISVRESLPYVSRGGLKLEGAIEAFSLNVSGCHGIDIGASTGGFTDCLLQHGAVSVTAVDVGRSQLDRKLAEDSRVTSYEGMNARYIKPEDIGGKGDIVVCDVSFISLERILPSLRGLLKEDGRLMTLIKPQFEVGRAGIGKGGIVKDRAAQENAVHNVKAAAADCGLRLIGFAVSPIVGGDGNREYLALFAPVYTAAVSGSTERSQTALTEPSADGTLKETDITQREADVTQKEADDTQREADVTQKEADVTQKEADDTQREVDDAQRKNDVAQKKADITQKEVSDAQIKKVVWS